MAEIEDLERLSIDLQHAFKDPQNTDLSIHFPDTVHRYSGELDGVQSSLLETMNKCVAGKREQFVTFCGKQAVGMSTVTNQNEAPEAVNPNWPNVSEFIFRPYRDTRLGTLTVRNCIEVVKERFDGRAWTYVRKGNVPAEQLVQQAGFVMTNIIVPGQEHQHVYLLGGDRQNRVWYNNR